MDEFVFVFSYFGKPPSRKDLTLARISNHLIIGKGYKTVLYIEKKYKNLFANIPYSEVIEFDDNILSQFPSTIWSAGKILAASLEKRPFFHIDFDFLVLNDNFINIIKNKDFVTYHCEPWFTPGFNKIIRYLDSKTKIFELNLSLDYISYNCAIFGSSRKEVVSLINQEAQTIINKILAAKELLTRFDIADVIDKAVYLRAGMAILMEQIIFMNNLHYRLKNINYQPVCVLSESERAHDTIPKGLEIGVAHLWGRKKLPEVLEQVSKIYNRIKKN